MSKTTGKNLSQFLVRLGGDAAGVPAWQPWRNLVCYLQDDSISLTTNSQVMSGRCDTEVTEVPQTRQRGGSVAFTVPVVANSPLSAGFLFGEAAVGQHIQFQRVWPFGSEAVITSKVNDRTFNNPEEGLVTETLILGAKSPYA